MAQNPKLLADHEVVSSTERSHAAARCTWVSVVVNTVLSALQVLVGVLAQSQALIADGLHSFSDLLSDFVVLIANRFSGQGSDQDHHYGHYRYENAATFAALTIATNNSKRR